MPDYSGKRIGNYLLLSELAHGAFGSVYLAQHHILTERKVAIKLLHTHLGSQAEQEQFIQEARFLEQLKHPHILTLMDVGIDDHLPYLVTEYAAGGSLRNLERQYQPGLLPINRTIDILQQVGRALEYAHSKNVIHRDLKPENILFDAQNKALLADFGIATMLSTVSMKYVTVVGGTPPYMAPEQFQGSASRESDQYALACVAYELFTGQAPFSAPDFVSMGFKHATVEPVPPRQLNPHLSSTVEHALLTALAKQRSTRYPDITTFVAALSTAQPQPKNSITTIDEELIPTYASAPPRPTRPVYLSKQVETQISQNITHTTSPSRQTARSTNKSLKVSKKKRPFRLVAIIICLSCIFEALLLLRFIFRSLSADPSAPFTGFLYALTDFALFGNVIKIYLIINGIDLELSPLIAIIIYGILFIAIIQLLHFLQKEPEY